jgi:hypothetical protein
MKKRKFYSLDEDVIIGIKVLALTAGKTESNYVNHFLKELINQSKKGLCIK